MTQKSFLGYYMYAFQKQAIQRKVSGTFGTDGETFSIKLAQFTLTLPPVYFSKSIRTTLVLQKLPPLTCT